MLIPRHCIALPLLAAFVCLSARLAPAQRTLGQWGLDGPAGQAVQAGDWGGEAEVSAAGATARYEDAAPSRYTYDPISGQSQANGGSVYLAPGDSPARIRVPAGAVAGSFTLEAFVKPESDPGTDLNYLVLAGAEGEGPMAGLGTKHLGRWHQTYMGAMAKAGGQRQRWNVGYYLGPGRIVGEAEKDAGWRHVALVYDAEAGEATLYLNRYETATQKVEGEVSGEDLSLFIGGLPGDKRGWKGWIDEVRLTGAALEPHQMLYAMDEKVSGASMASEPTILPEEAGYISVKRFGAVGDGKTDDTAAFNRAFEELANKVPLRYHTLYIPPGEYVISDQITWSRFLVVQGAGRERTTIKLKDNAEGFGDPENPDAAVYTGWKRWRQGMEKSNAGNVIGNYLFDLTIDTGKGNPGAVALSFHCNNHGTIENVTVRSGDGRGHTGLDFSVAWPGPMLVKHVHIDGFDHGVKARHGEYSLVFEDLKLTNQRKVGMAAGGNVFTIRKLTSINDVPAIEADGWGMISLIDSELISASGDPAPAAITGPKNAGLFVRHVKTSGYATAIELEGRDDVQGPNIDEFVAGEVRMQFDSPKRSLGLPIKETPEIPIVKIDHWTNVADHADEVSNGDWAPVLQKLIDGGAEALLFPANTKVTVKQPVVFRGNVKYVLGMKSKGAIGNAEGYDGVTTRIAGRSGSTIVFERLGLGHLEHVSQQTAVFRHGGPGVYHGQRGAGDVFYDDAQGKVRLARGQKFWGRQVNIETRGEGNPEILNDGGRMWLLGFKTEYKSINIANRNGGMVEMLGGFLYPVGGSFKGPLMRNHDGRWSLTFTTSAYRADHGVYIDETWQGTHKELTNKQVDRNGPRRRVHLYICNP